MAGLPFCCLMLFIHHASFLARSCFCTVLVVKETYFVLRVTPIVAAAPCAGVLATRASVVVVVVAAVAVATRGSIVAVVAVAAAGVTAVVSLTPPRLRALTISVSPVVNVKLLSLTRPETNCMDVGAVVFLVR